MHRCCPDTICSSSSSAAGKSHHNYNAVCTGNPNIPPSETQRSILDDCRLPTFPTPPRQGLYPSRSGTDTVATATRALLRRVMLVHILLHPLQVTHYHAHYTQSCLPCSVCSITILGTGQLFSTGGTVGMLDSIIVGSTFFDSGATATDIRTAQPSIIIDVSSHGCLRGQLTD